VDQVVWEIPEPAHGEAHSRREGIVNTS
jgi:hypothetical protein